jgi:hypothetical protein
LAPVNNAFSGMYWTLLLLLSPQETFVSSPWLFSKRNNRCLTKCWLVSALGTHIMCYYYIVVTKISFISKHGTIFFFYCCAGWGYIVVFTKVLTMYQTHLHGSLKKDDSVQGMEVCHKEYSVILWI